MEYRDYKEKKEMVVQMDKMVILDLEYEDIIFYYYNI